MPLMENPIRASAAKARCDYETPFNQATISQHVPEALMKQGAELQYVKTGLCNGLAFSWLRRESADGPNTLFTDLKLPVTGDPTPSRSYQLLKQASYHHKDFQMLEDYKKLADAQPTLGLKPSARKSDEGETEIKHKSFNVSEKDEVKALATWLGKTITKRYFIVHTQKHAMAATGSRIGDLKFFDPNGGVVRARTADRMSDFLFDYFSRKRNYFGPIRQVDVYKFSAADQEGSNAAAASEPTYSGFQGLLPCMK
jgi:hypothetical protein